MSIDQERLTWNGQTPSDQTLPKLFSRPFVERLHQALFQGKASVRWTAKLIDGTIEDIEDLFKEYQMKVPFDL